MIAFVRRLRITVDRGIVVEAQTVIRYACIWLFLAALPLAAVSDIRRPAPQSAIASTTANPPSRRDSSPLPSPDGHAVGSFLSDNLARLPATPLIEQPWFLDVQHQLRQLGASYIRLEKWHSEPAVYYFECRLEPGHAAATAAQLSSLSASPEAATFDVLRRVQRLAHAVPADVVDEADRPRNSLNRR